jgi:hypothetical protein
MYSFIGILTPLYEDYSLTDAAGSWQRRAVDLTPWSRPAEILRRF